MIESASKYLVKAFGYAPSLSYDRGVCALCGATDEYVEPLKKHITAYTADLADSFRHGDKHICVNCAALFSDSRFTGNLLAVDGRGIKPFVALSSATSERPAWRNLVRELPIGTHAVTVMTSNTKRRLWPKAPLSVIGSAWRVLFVDSDLDTVLTVDIARLRDCLDTVEEIYALGISKPAMQTSVFTIPHKLATTIGFNVLRDIDTRLQQWRGTHEFIIALFIAQKEDEKP